MEKNNQNQDVNASSLTRYKKDYDQGIIDHMSKGYSFMSYAGEIGVCPKTLYNWVDSHESFKQAKEIATSKALKLFEGALLDKLMGQEATVYSLKNSEIAAILFALKTRFKEVYSERTEIAQSHDIKINIDESDSNL